MMIKGRGWHALYRQTFVQFGKRCIRVVLSIISVYILEVTDECYRVHTWNCWVFSYVELTIRRSSSPCDQGHTHFRDMGAEYLNFSENVCS